MLNNFNWDVSSGLAGGIQQGAQGISAGLDKAITQWKALQDGSKATDYLKKANPQAFESMGIHDEEWKTMGARDKIAVGKAIMQKQSMDEQQARIADQQSQINERNSIGAWRQSQAQKEADAATHQEMFQRAITDAAAPAPPNSDDDIAALYQKAGLAAPAGTPAKPPLDANAMIQIGLQTGALSAKDAAEMMQKSGRRTGQQLPPSTPDGMVLDGATQDENGGLKYTFKKPETAPEPMGTTHNTDAGDFVSLGDGKYKFTSKSDIANSDTGKMRANFETAAPEMGRKLDQFEDVVNKYGNSPETTYDAKAVAAQMQLPFQIVENYNKMVDANSVNRPEKLLQDMLHLTPKGLMTRNAVTVAGIQNLRKEAIGRISDYVTRGNPLPPNLPASIYNELKLPGLGLHPDSKFQSVKEALEAGTARGAKAGQTVQVYDPATLKYRPFQFK